MSKLRFAVCALFNGILSTRSLRTGRALRIMVAFTVFSAMVLPTAFSFTPVVARSQEPDGSQGGPSGKIVESYRKDKNASSGNANPIGRGNKNNEDLPEFARESTERSIAHLRQNDPNFLASDPAADLEFFSADKDDLNQTHLRLNQVQQGVPVFGGQLIVHLDSQSVLNVYGKVYKDARRVDIKPRLNVKKAIEQAQEALGYKGQFAKPPQAELIILPHQISHNEAGASLSYLVELLVLGGDKMGRYNYFIDANNGGVLWSYNSLAQADAYGLSLYSGRVKFDLRELRPFQLVDAHRGGMFVVNMRDQDNPALALPFDDTYDDFIWGNGATTDSQTVAVDALYGANKTWDYFHEVHGNNLVDGNSGTIIRQLSPLKLGVHYVKYPNDPNKRNPNNAYWTGEGVYLGAGDQNARLPVVSLDVIGHEITHGIYEAVIGRPAIYQKEPGAVNESFADIFGTAVEFYARPATSRSRPPNYSIGEDYVIINAPNAHPDAPKAVRSLADPVLYGHPDHYNGRKYKQDNCEPILDPYDPLYNDGCGVHTNSGIQNKVFYLLSKGGEHNNKTVKPIYRYAAERIFFRALLKICLNDGFSEVRRKTLDAAKELYSGGIESQQYKSVKDAWDAVGVGYVVTTTQDNGNNQNPIPGSLRKAILDANAEEGDNKILFDIYGDAPFVISLMSALPEITGLVEINGASQEGFLPAGNPIIKLDGLNAGIAHGLVLRAGNCKIKSLTLTGFSGSGILIEGEGGHVIENTHINPSS